MRRTRLIAVLVVIVFIVFAVALLLPARSRQRESGPRVSCLSNLKQLGLATKQYAQDYDDRYPWRVGAEDRWDAWRDLGMLFPNYCTGFATLICPSSGDRGLRAPSTEGVNADKGPLDPFAADLTISYGYCFDARESTPRAWTDQAPATVRLAADKTAGVGLTERSNHGLDGRNVLYQDGHVDWERGVGALDPRMDDDAIGAPGAWDYRRWWSDPPYSQERREVKER